LQVTDHSTPPSRWDPTAAAACLAAGHTIKLSRKPRRGSVDGTHTRTGGQPELTCSSIDHALTSSSKVEKLKNPEPPIDPADEICIHPAGYSSRRISLRSRVAAAAASTAATATAFLVVGNCGSGSELGSGDVENAGPAYTSTAGLTFLPRCLRPAAGDDVPTGCDLLLVAPGWW